MSNKSFDFLIVGSGFAGCVLAERIATVLNKRVLLVDSRNHIGGNAYDYFNEHGILIHQYGPHIFHTNSKNVFDYLSQFTDWTHYQHMVLAHVEGRKVPIPINLNTINQLYGMKLTCNEIGKYFESIREPLNTIKNSEDVIVSKVGWDLYNKFFKYYTKKQWGLWPSELHQSVCARIPVRTNRDDRYFSDKYQVMPKYGYTAMFNNMLKQPNIHILLQTDFEMIKSLINYKYLIYTGPIDAYFKYKHGKLPYRSLKFDFQTINKEWFQEVAVINYPNDYDFTRITEFKHLTGQNHNMTTIVYEYPTDEGDPYYPIPKESNMEIYARYKTEADTLKNVWFVGRLGTYKYYNMDQVVAQVLTLFENEIKHIN